MIIRREETGPTWRELLNQGTEQLLAAGIDEAGLDAWYLLSEAFGIDRVHYYMEQEKPVREERLNRGLGRYRDMLSRRASRIPLQQILGNASFMGLTFAVNEHVLIPRQDTEVLTEQVLADYPGRDITVLDVCTGTGCIAISLAVLGKYRTVCGTDISGEALAVANRNARSLFLGQKGVFKGTADHVSDTPWRTDYSVKTEEGERYLVLAQSDLFRGIPEGDQFDVIVSNPPYIASAVIDTLAPEVKDHEPRLALDGKEDGLFFYRILAEESRKHLAAGGRIYLEIGYDQSESVADLLKNAGFTGIRTVRDLAGLDRVVTAEYSGNS
ncbi:MAG: peptide chain release factor N(5)-glutamine methyltransferase [Clostridium sp.]|nr:peptide chain release factor N(5)-glutamine methyltransferase [Clostridium sp.]